MAGFLNHKMADDGGLGQGKVSDKIEDLVPDKFIFVS